MNPSRPVDRPQQFEFACQSAGYAPMRRPNSVRRTTSIDSIWPNGFGQPWEMFGRARDLLTLVPDAKPEVLAAAQYRVLASPSREIMEIEASPDHPRLQEMVGVRAGGASRRELADRLGDVSGTPLYQVLDDFAGASLVAGWIWSQWSDDWAEQVQQSRARSNIRSGPTPNICTGFAEGASSLDPEGGVSQRHQSATAVGPVENPEDPLGWHPMPVQQGPQKRRSRRIDVWREGNLIKTDMGFQDSGPNPQGGRTAIHEYRVFAEIAADTGVLVALQALPMILPFRECPGASIKATRLIGQNVGAFRDAVIETLPSTLGCTHLNDVLRAMADIPLLARSLP